MLERLWEELKVWLSLPFAMPGPINTIWPWPGPGTFAVIGLVGLVGPMLSQWRTSRWRLPRLMPHRDRLLFGIPNWLSNSTIPFLRCEVLYKLNAAFVDPHVWRTHTHLRQLARPGHFDELDMSDTCIKEAHFTQRQVTWLNRLPLWIKEHYRQRMFAAIHSGEPLKFGYRQWSKPHREMTEEGPDGLGKLILNEGS